jgi:hypothetical protein
MFRLAEEEEKRVAAKKAGISQFSLSDMGRRILSYTHSLQGSVMHAYNRG